MKVKSKLEQVDVKQRFALEEREGEAVSVKVIGTELAYSDNVGGTRMSSYENNSEKNELEMQVKQQEENKTNTLDFNYERPVVKADGSMGSQSCTIHAPRLSLVPLPAFTMDELTVDFNMEVKDIEMSDDKTHTDVSSTVSYNSWFGLDASITGNVTSDSEHKRQTDSSAAYTIHAHEVQQQPSKGMAKLNSLFEQAMEPINTKNNT